MGGKEIPADGGMKINLFLVGVMEFRIKCVSVNASITMVNHAIKQVSVILANQLWTQCLVL